MMVLNTQMKYLFSYKMFIRYLYLYIKVYTRKAEKKDPSQRSFAGGSSTWVKAIGLGANRHPTSCLPTPLFTMAVGKGPKKTGKKP